MAETGQRMIYRCTKDVINKNPVYPQPYLDEEYYPELVTYTVFYSFVKGYTYNGKKANHPKTREEGVMFSNHQGVDHFISLGVLREHFEEAES